MNIVLCKADEADLGLLHASMVKELIKGYSWRPGLLARSSNRTSARG